MHDLAIGESGVAGLSAVVHSVRADLEPLVFEGDVPDGQLTLATDVKTTSEFPLRRRDRANQARQETSRAIRRRVSARSHRVGKHILVMCDRTNVISHTV